MTITEFPTRPSGGVSWKTLARSVHPGDLVTLPRAQATGAQKQLSNYGIRCRTRRNADGQSATIEILTPVTEKPSRIAFVETPATLAAKIAEARENLGYWRRQKLIRTDHQARIQAGARVLLWEGQLAALQAKQEAPQAKPPTIIDCGSGHPYGICPKCHRAHGTVLVSQ